MSGTEKILELGSRKCVPCETATPYTISTAQSLLRELPGWSLDSSFIFKEFRFKSYLSGLEFACALGRAAEAEDHHPDMLIAWRRVRVSLSTRAIRGLSQNDFIMAAKAELAYQKAIGKT